jgi:hypothetical protein
VQPSAAIPRQWPDDGAWRFGVVAQRLLDGDREHVAP